MEFLIDHLFKNQNFIIILVLYLKLFDLITLSDVLEHVSEPSQMINDVLQYLRPSGLLLLNLPMIDTLPARFLNKFWPFYLEVHLYYFTIQTINQFLKINGFIKYLI